MTASITFLLTVGTMSENQIANMKAFFYNQAMMSDTKMRGCTFVCGNYRGFVEFAPEYEAEAKFFYFAWRELIDYNDHAEIWIKDADSGTR